MHHFSCLDLFQFFFFVKHKQLNRNVQVFRNLLLVWKGMHIKKWFSGQKKILQVLAYGISSQLGACGPQRVLKGISGASEAFPLTFSLSPYSFFFLLKLAANAKIFAQHISYAEKPVTRKQHTSVWATFSCKRKSFHSRTCVTIKANPSKVDVEYVRMTLAARANCLTLRL